jgi:hypothetical protein
MFQYTTNNTESKETMRKRLRRKFGPIFVTVAHISENLFESCEKSSKKDVDTSTKECYNVAC